MWYFTRKLQLVSIILSMVVLCQSYIFFWHNLWRLRCQFHIWTFYCKTEIAFCASDQTFECYVVNLIHEHFITKQRLLFMGHLLFFVCLLVCLLFFFYLFIFIFTFYFIYIHLFLANCKLQFTNYISQSISFVAEIFLIGF